MRQARWCAGLLSLLLSGPAGAESIDPSLPSVVVIGPHSSPAPMARLDAARTNRSRFPLPSRPVEKSKKTLGPLAHPPIVGKNGDLWVALTSPELVRLGADGQELSRVRVGAAPAMREPVLLPNGGVAVITGAPAVTFVSASGKVEATVLLPRASFALQSLGGVAEGWVSILANADGSVVVVASRALLSLDASGRVGLRATLPERIISDPIPHDGGYLVLGEGGGVYRVAPPAEPRKLGTLSGALPGTALLVDARTLLVQAAPNRVLSLDLKSGATATRVGDTLFSSLDTPLAWGSDGTLWATTLEGFLVGFDRAGAELSRTPLDRHATPPGLFSAPRSPFAPPGSFSLASRLGPIVDGEGRVAFARQQGRVGVRDQDGRLSFGAERGCTTPLALIPLGNQQLLLACREGTLITFGQADATE